MNSEYKKLNLNPKKWIFKI